MPPAATVDFRPPFDSSNSPANQSSTNSPTFNTGSSFSTATRAGPTRAKARLFKHRRSSKDSSNTGSTAGINPFRSVNLQNIDGSSSCNDSSFDQSGKNVSFVFGKHADNCSTGANVGLQMGNLENMGNGFRDSAYLPNEKSSCDFSNVGKPCFGVNNSPDGMIFRFGAGAENQAGNNNVKFGETVQETELSNGMRKLNIEQKMDSFHAEPVQVSHKMDTVKDGESLFVFKTGEKNLDTPSECSIPMKGEENGKNLDGKKGSVNAGKPCGFGSHSANENVFVFGSSGNTTKHGVFCSQSSACPPEVRRKSEWLSSGLVSQIDQEKPETGSVFGETHADHSSTSFSASKDFKLPNFDASIPFSAILSNGPDSKDSGLRSRVSKHKKVKKTKAKLRQPKPIEKQFMQKSQFCQSNPKEEETAECYSPMDFSPCEDTATNDDEPLTSNQTTDRAKVTNVNSSSPCAESQSRGIFKDNRLGVASTDFSAFVASSSVSSRKHLQKKKYRLKTANASATRGSTLGGNNLASEYKGKPETEEKQEHGCESSLSEAEKACDEWRRRGNEAYGKGQLSTAENFYTWGINYFPPACESDIAFKPLVRCYSNRAATRMAVGRVREAIKDCRMAVKLDSTFHKAHMRAANCHLLLGELDEAMQCFNQLTPSANVVCLDRQAVISASEGIQKCQKVVVCMNRSAELLKLRTSDATASALELIAEAMSVSLYSEKLLEMKAETLCMLGKHEEAVALCQQSLDFAEKNFPASSSGKHESNSSYMDVRLWRNHISSKCYFHLGRLEVALDLLEKNKCANRTQESSNALAVTMHELLKQKSAGNTAFQSGKHAEAVEHYTSAILSSMESRPFAAICFCNRAAAHQVLGQITDAIADCSLAIALDGNYAKAVSRRATLHEMIRDYKHAAVDLHRLVSLLENQSCEKSQHRGSGNKELGQVQQRISSIEGEAKKDVPLDLYLILGVKKTDPVSEIKKAYRKAALRHHPDKAGLCLVRTDAGDEGRSWKDIAELVHNDSDRLFKMIGEAYAVLSDPTKREDYDHDEDMRKALKEANSHRSTSRRQSEYFYQSSPFERSSNRRSWQDGCRTYSYKRW